MLQRGQAGCSDDGIARQSACLIDGPIGSDHSHEIRPSSVGSTCRPPSHDLAQRREVRRHVEQLLSPAKGDAEPVITSSKISMAP